MNTLYNLALRQSSSIQTDLSLLESNGGIQSSSFSSLVGQLTISLQAFNRTIDDYENMAKRELNIQKREKALQRVKKFREEEKEMRNAFIKVKSNSNNLSEQNPSGSSTPLNFNGKRNEDQYDTIGQTSSSLHHHQHHQVGTNNINPSNNFNSSLHSRGSIYQNNPSTNGFAGALPPQNRPDPLQAYRMNASAAAMFGGDDQGGSGMSVREGYALREHSFIQQTESQLDSFISQGKEVWTNLTEQRDILKGTQRRLRDVGVTLGLSRDVIGYIERRSTQDNVLFVIGVIFTLICFYYIYKWFG